MTLSRLRVERQPVESGDDEDVVGFEPADHIGELGASVLAPRVYEKTLRNRVVEIPTKRAILGA
jgi:hypothetical protein